MAATLFCLLYGDDPRRVFAVQVPSDFASTFTVAQLRSLVFAQTSFSNSAAVAAGAGGRPETPYTAADVTLYRIDEEDALGVTDDRLRRVSLTCSPPHIQDMFRVTELDDPLADVWTLLAPRDTAQQPRLDFLVKVRRSVDDVDSLAPLPPAYSEALVGDEEGDQRLPGGAVTFRPTSAEPSRLEFPGKSQARSADDPESAALREAPASPAPMAPIVNPARPANPTTSGSGVAATVRPVSVYPKLSSQTDTHVPHQPVTNPSATNTLVAIDGDQIETASNPGMERQGDPGNTTGTRQGKNGRAALFSVRTWPRSRRYLALSVFGVLIVIGIAAGVFKLMQSNHEAPASTTQPTTSSTTTSSILPTPTAVADRSLRTFVNHTDGVNTMAISADGKQFFSASRDHTVKQWDITGQIIRNFAGHRDWVNGLALSPDGTLFSGSGDHTIIQWNISTANVLQQFPGHSDGVNTIVLSPDGRFVFSGSYDKTIKLWSVETGENIGTFTGHSGQVYSLAVSPDGRHLFSASGDFTIRQWDVATGETLQIFTGHTDQVNGIALSQDGTMLFSGSGDNTIIQWNVTTTRSVKKFAGHPSGIRCVALSRDGTLLFSGGVDKTIKEWIVDTAENVHTFPGHRDEVLALATSPDLKQVFSGSTDKTIKLWTA
ncbi:WD40-repeat-containing domain protein [Fimicolochytrium jonesii]|uniref:WD40-repeat-containing domain protein n=1 Tax=Fimicolochytrium jonesii TaxID=1396493 RepID=UPI0022FDC0A1|nr:WD40-repeat-containing domain protein [Fimicolochytrium jonesii]KAI8817867.1 WD40-repeat-containing domain protein [Fimicolochytrium jonesii]